MKHTFSLIGMIVLLSACRPSPSFDSKLYQIEEKVVLLHRECRSGSTELCIRADELIASAEKPDVVMKISELPDFLYNDRSEFPREKLFQIIEGNMEGLYNSYHFFMRFEEEGNWKDDEDFLNLDLWFYAFETGPEGYSRAGLFPFFPKRSGYYRTFCFVLRDDVVIFSHSIFRPVEARNKKINTLFNQK
jgi:hypothetical protein